MRWFASPGALCLGVWLGGCGGKVVVDLPAGTGGGGGSGGAASSSGTSSTGGASSSSASSTTSSSSTTASSAGSSSSSTGGTGCPDPFPGIYATCDQEGLKCSVPFSCCGGVSFCKNGFWQYAGAPDCGEPCTPDCGPDDFTCQAGTLCVAYIGPVTTYQCRVNPCFQGVSCGCAGPLCEEQMMTCNNIQDGYKVLCD